MRLCAVYQCAYSNDLQKTENKIRPTILNFFHFPKDDLLCKQWILVCGKSDDLESKDLHARFICSLHFKADEITGNRLTRARLVKDAVPTLNLPITSFHKQNKERPSRNEIPQDRPPDLFTAEEPEEETYKPNSRPNGSDDNQSYQDIDLNEVCVYESMSMDGDRVEPIMDCLDLNNQAQTLNTFTDKGIKLKATDDAYNTQVQDGLKNGLEENMVVIKSEPTSDPEEIVEKMAIEYDYPIEPEESSCLLVLKIEDETLTESEKTQHKCSICEKTYSSIEYLNLHMESIHSGLRPRKCKFCPKSFSQMGNLNRHMNTFHCGLKHHKCRICEKTFSQSGDLKLHIDTIHSGLRPHICRICQMAFSRKGSLDRHLNRVHRGELRPHKC